MGRGREVYLCVRRNVDLEVRAWRGVAEYNFLQVRVVCMGGYVVAPLPGAAVCHNEIMFCGAAVFIKVYAVDARIEMCIGSSSRDMFCVDVKAGIGGICRGEVADRECEIACGVFPWR